MKSTVPGLSKTPFIRIVIPFICGIIFYRFFPSIQPLFLAITTSVIIVLLILYQFIPFFRESYSKAIYWGIMLNVCLFLSGYYLCYNKIQNSENILLNKSGFVSGELIEQPTIKEKTIKTVLEVKAIRVKNEWINTNGKVILYFQKDKKSLSLKNGDNILFEPDIQEIENAGNPKEFDYKQYLAFHLITHQAYLKSQKWQVVGKSHNTNLVLFSENIRNNLLNVLRKYGFKNETFAVTSAITLGYKNELDAEVKKAYSSSGAMHILAVSGLHVGVVYIVIELLLLFMKRRKFLRILKAIIIVTFLWFYALLTGLSPSVLRAATMFSFVVVGKALNRQTNIYNTLSSSAFILLIINPLILFDVGFQLSYLAVIGIVFFQPMIYKNIYVKNKFLDKIWGLTSVGIAAQIITLPLSLFYFHQFPNYFLLTGLVVIPLSSVIIYVTMFLLAISSWSWGASIIAKGLIYIVDFMNWSVITIEKLPGAVFANIPFNLWQVILFYGSILLATQFLINKKILWLKLFLVSIILILGLNIYESTNIKLQRKVFVYNIKGISTINFIDGTNNVLFSDIDLQQNNSSYSLKGNWLSLGVEGERIVSFAKLNEQFLFSNLLTTNNENLFFKNNFFNFYGCKIVALRDKFNVSENINNKMPINYLILSKNVDLKISDLLKVFIPKQIIIDSSNSKSKINNWVEQAKLLNINCFVVSEQGAFEIDI